jgi:hypothetical protein
LQRRGELDFRPQRPPHISRDPVADSTDLYAFVTPPNPNSPWNRQQTFSLTRVDHTRNNRWGAEGGTLLGSGLLCPPCNIGPLSTPNYQSLAGEAIQSVPAGPFSASVFAGQRAEGFYVDLGSVFDLGDLRPFAGLHAGAGQQPVAVGIHARFGARRARTV